MRSVSQSYLDYINSSLVRCPHSKVVIDGVTYDGLSYLVSYPKISHKTEKACGAFPAKTCEFEIFNRDGTLSLNGKEVTVYRGLEIGGIVQWVQLGIFSAEDKDITTNINKKTISFKGTDRTRLFDKPYGGRERWGNGNIELYKILNDIRMRLNIFMTSLDFPLSDYLFPDVPPGLDFDNITERQMVSYCAELAGCVALIAPDGRLQMKPATETDVTISKTKYKSLSVEKALGPIDAVSFGYADYDDALLYGNEADTRVEWAINDNPLTTTADRNNLIERVSEVYFGRSFVPFELTDFIDDYIFDLNDTVTIEKKDGSTVKVTILEMSQTSRIKSSFKATVQTPGKADSKLAGSVKESVKQISLKVDHQNNRIEMLATDGAGLSSRLEATESKITQTAERVTHIENAGYITEEAAKAYIATQADSIKLAVEKNIKVGAVNLLLDTESFFNSQGAYYRSTANSGYPVRETQSTVPSKLSTQHYYKCTTAGNEVGVSFTNSTSNKILACDLSEILPNEKYTFSFWAKGDSSTSGKTISLTYLLNCGSGVRVVYDANLTDDLILTTSWKRYRVTFYIEKAATAFKIQFWHAGTANTNYNFFLSSLKLESGTVLTDWELNGKEYASAADIDMCVKTDENGVIQSEISMTADRVSIDSTNFKLTKAGIITATSGAIGGWTINANSIYAGETKLSNDGKITSGSSKENQAILDNGHIDFYYNGTRSFRLGQTNANAFSLEDKNNSPRYFIFPIKEWENDYISSAERTIVGASGGFVITANSGQNALVLEGKSIHFCGAITAYNDITANTLINSPKYNLSGKTAMQIYSGEFAVGLDSYVMSLYAKDKIKCQATLCNSSGTAYKLTTSTVEGYTTATDTGETIIPDNFMDYFKNSDVTISPTQLLTTASHTSGSTLYEDPETGEIIEEPIIIPESTTRVEAGVDFTSAETTPDILISDDGVDMYSMMCLTWKGVKNLHERLTAIENSLN